jgi:hypothetical protein
MAKSSPFCFNALLQKYCIFFLVQESVMNIVSKLYRMEVMFMLLLDGASGRCCFIFSNHYLDIDV